MSYNIGGNVFVRSNADIGDVVLSSDQIRYLCSSSLSYRTPPGGRLVLDCDLGTRLHIKTVNYYFESSEEYDASTVASGITFSYKDEIYQDYVTMETVAVAGDKFSASISGAVFAPICLRIEQDYTTVSGTLKGLEIVNNGDIVNFGTDGADTDAAFDVVKGGDPVIREIPIFNSGTKKASALVSVEPTHTAFDETMALALSKDGPWNDIVDSGKIVTDSQSYSSGVFNNTVLAENTIKIVGWIDGNGNFTTDKAFGVYQTRIFEVTGSYSRPMLKMQRLKEQVKTDGTDSVETLEVRSSKNRPATYSVLRILKDYYVGSDHFFRYVDYWRQGMAVKENSTWNILSAYRGSSWRKYYITMDPRTKRWAGYAYFDGGSSYTSYMRLFNCVGGSFKEMNLSYASYQSISSSWRSIKLDADGGTWVYFYSSAHHSSDFVSTGGYYLAYFDKDLVNRFKYQSSDDFMVHMDVVYETKQLWYIDKNSDLLQKLNFDGDVLVRYYDNLDNAGAVVAKSDGGCWFSNGNDLYHVSTHGILIDSLFGVDSYKVVYLANDLTDQSYLWATDGFKVMHICVGGENKGWIDIDVEINSPVKLFPVNEGCWVFCTEADDTDTDTYMRFLSKENKRVDCEYKSASNSVPGVMEITCEDAFYAGLMPIEIDNEWKDLEWRKVNLHNFYLPDDKYQQFRITLQRQTAADRYGLENHEETYTNRDDFNQPDGLPAKTHLWGEWSGNNRVHIENNELVLTRSDGILQENSYIRTINRILVGGNFDVRFTFRLDEATQGLEENIYLYAIAVDSVHSGQNVGSRLYIPSNITTSKSYLYGGINGSWSGTYAYDLGLAWNRRSGILRLYTSGDNVVASIWDVTTNSWKSTPGRPGYLSAGDKFYIQIVSGWPGSSLYISNFEVVSGTVFYYTDSPEIAKVYLQNEIVLDDLYPNTYKPVFFKTRVDDALAIETNSYDVDLRVRWRIPV